VAVNGADGDPGQRNSNAGYSTFAVTVKAAIA